MGKNGVGVVGDAVDGVGDDVSDDLGGVGGGVVGPSLDVAESSFFGCFRDIFITVSCEIIQLWRENEPQSEPYFSVKSAL